MFPTLPGLNFRLLGFPVTIGLDFLIVVLLFSSIGGTTPDRLVLWLVIVTASLLIHELGHAYTLRAFGTHPSIRLWGLGGLTLSGFALPPRRQILVSVAGPAVGIVLGIVIQILRPWLPPSTPGYTLLDVAAAYLIFVNLGWGIFNLLPISGLDGGAIVENAFLLVFGQRGRTPGLVVVAVASIVAAIGSMLLGLGFFVAILVVLFGLMNPAPYQELWRLVQPSGPGRAVGRWTQVSDAYGLVRAYERRRAAAPEELDEPAPRHDRVTAVHQAAEPDARRHFAAIYAETFPDSAADTEEIERRPEPLLADVSGMLARREASAAAGRLAREDDPLAVLGVVARVIDARQVKAVAAGVRREDASLRESALLKLQVALHALAAFGEAVEVGQELARTAPNNAASAILLARSAARRGNRPLVAESLARVAALGGGPLSEAALADVARLGPDARVAEQLSRLRGTRTT